MTEMSYEQEEKKIPFFSHMAVENKIQNRGKPGAEFDPTTNVKFETYETFKSEPLFEIAEATKNVDHQKLQEMSHVNADFKLEGDLRSLDYKVEVLDIYVKSEIDDLQLGNEELLIKDEVEIDPSMVETEIGRRKMFECNECRYQCWFKSKLKEHMVVHKDPSELEMFKCIKCNYQSKRKTDLKKHMRVHRDLSQLETFKSNDLSLGNMELLIKEEAEIDPNMIETEIGRRKMFECNECRYQCQFKSRLKEHMVVHKDPSELEMFNCNLCSYQAKRKSDLNRHKWVHRDLSQIETFKCNGCSFESNHRQSLRQHMVLHKDLSQVKIFQCNECDYQCKDKSNRKRHTLIHKDFSEVRLFKCNECGLDSKYKESLKQHLLVHKNLSRIFKCHECKFETKYKHNLNKHMLLHEVR